jgi:MFS transporter, DHA1 family, multidrug resistance protein
MSDRADLWAVSGSTVIVMLGQGIIAPVLPLYAADFGVSLTMIGVVLSAFALARMVLNTPLGLVADRKGRRPLLVGGPLILAVGMAGSGFAPNIGVLIVWRFVSGVGSAMYMTGAMIYLADIAGPDQRARYLGTNQAAVQLGVSIGPAIGGLISEVFGLRSPFYFVAGSATLAALYAWFRLVETRPDRAPQTERNGKRGQWRLLLRSPGFLSVSLVAMAVFLTRGTARGSLVPLMGSEIFGMSAGKLGLLLSAMSALNLLLLPTAGWIADRFGRRIAIIPSLAGTAFALTLFGLADSLPPFLVAAGVLAVASSVSGPAPAAFAADAAPDDMRGLAFGIYRTAGDFGLLIGPPLLGAIADAVGFGPAFFVNAGLVAGVGVVFAIWGWPAPRRNPSD